MDKLSCIAPNQSLSTYKNNVTVSFSKQSKTKMDSMDKAKIERVLQMTETPQVDYFPAPTMFNPKQAESTVVAQPVNAIGPAKNYKEVKPLTRFKQNTELPREALLSAQFGQYTAKVGMIIPQTMFTTECQRETRHQTIPRAVIGRGKEDVNADRFKHDSLRKDEVARQFGDSTRQVPLALVPDSAFATKQPYSQDRSHDIHKFGPDKRKEHAKFFMPCPTKEQAKRSFGSETRQVGLRMVGEESVNPSRGYSFQNVKGPTRSLRKVTDPEKTDEVNRQILWRGVVKRETQATVDREGRRWKSTLDRSYSGSDQPTERSVDQGLAALTKLFVGKVTLCIGVQDAVQSRFLALLKRITGGRNHSTSTSARGIGCGSFKGLGTKAVIPPSPRNHADEELSRAQFIDLLERIKLDTLPPADQERLFQHYSGDGKVVDFERLLAAVFKGDFKGADASKTTFWLGRFDETMAPDLANAEKLLSESAEAKRAGGCLTERGGVATQSPAPSPQQVGRAVAALRQKEQRMRGKARQQQEVEAEAMRRQAEQAQRRLGMQSSGLATMQTGSAGSFGPSSSAPTLTMPGAVSRAAGTPSSPSQRAAKAEGILASSAIRRQRRDQRSKISYAVGTESSAGGGGSGELVSGVYELEKAEVLGISGGVRRWGVRVLINGRLQQVGSFDSKQKAEEVFERAAHRINSAAR
jgi:hypothetical protein